LEELPGWRPFIIASGKAGFSTAGDLHQTVTRTFTWRLSLAACLVAEIVFTFMFLMIILGATDKEAPAGLATRWQ